MSISRNIFTSAAVGILSVATLCVTSPVHADGAGAFLGGVLAAKVVGNMNAQTQAAQDSAQAQQVQAYNSSHQQSSGSDSQSPEARMKELDKLAAGGYITPEEYKKKKQAIVDSL